MLLVLGLTGISTMVIVVVLSAEASSDHLTSVQEHIQAGITSKGRVLTHQHALALRGLTLDNAFSDIQQLVEGAVREDSELVYGMYLNSDLAVLAYSDRRGAAGTAPAGEAAWKELGLKQDELLVRRELAARVQRLGRDVLEVAYPVHGEDGELIGTIRYGLSTARMTEALSSAEAEARAQLLRSLLLIGGLVGVATLLALLLSRMEAVRITKPLGELTRAADDLAKGNRGVRVEIGSGDELQLLGNSFNRMVADLDASYRELEQMNRTLEHKVEERTAELARKNRDMRLVLDNVDQGFITLDARGQMAQERSAVVDRWFGECDKPRTFWEYIGLFSRSFGLEFQLAWEQVTDGILPLELCLDQMPERLSAGGRTWSLRCLPFMRDDKLEGMLLVIAEITERLAREREDAEQHELMQGFKKLMLDRSGFALFLREAGTMVEQIHGRSLEHDPVLLKRTLHTLKGNAGLMGLTVVAHLCHLLEDQVADGEPPSATTLEELQARWTAITEHVANFIGKTRPKVIEIPEAEYTSLVSRLAADTPQAELLDQLLSWQLEPVSRSFERLADQALSLSRRLGKGDLNIDVQPNNVRLDLEVWSPLFSDLTHLIRNAIDHGIETPSEREAAGKPARGTLLLRAQSTGKVLTLELGDDGRGIDWEAIAHKARERGLPATTPAELLNALCHDGITTRGEVSETSGRGVGMSALRERVRQMDGRIEVRSARGVGTTWILRFPLPDRARQRRDRAPGSSLAGVSTA